LLAAASRRRGTKNKLKTPAAFLVAGVFVRWHCYELPRNFACLSAPFKKLPACRAVVEGRINSSASFARQPTSDPFY
jgi:hypothetical protein